RLVSAPAVSRGRHRAGRVVGRAVVDDNEFQSTRRFLADCLPASAYSRPAMLFIWIGFILFVLAMLALDLGVFHRSAHVVKVREALIWSAIWIALALLFSVFVYFGYDHHWMGLGARVDAVDGTVNDGTRATVKYLTGYVIEKSLSVDNIFVIAMLFAFFAVPAIYQHRVLFWGILGAL